MGLCWGAGGGGGAAWTPVQLQYDVDVRVVVHRAGAAAARAFISLDLTLSYDKKSGRANDSTQILDRNATVGGRGLGFTRLRDNWSFAKTRFNIEMIDRETAALSRLSRSRASH